MWEAALFSNVIAGNHANCMLCIFASDRDGVLNAIHPVLKAQAQSLMLQEYQASDTAGPRAVQAGQ